MLSFTRRFYEKSGEGGGGGGLAQRNGGGQRRPVVGLALGSGAARGWAHIGVLRELADNGLAPDIIAGTSIGAVVGGCFAADRLDAVESFARSLTSKKRLFGLMDLSFSGGAILNGEKLRAQLEEHVGDRRIEDLRMPFAAVATECGSGHELWLTRGHLNTAIRASYAMPGIFEPVKIGGRWLFDGALVNPIPVTVCRALGADIVIAVNLISDNLFRGTVIHDQGVIDRTLESVAKTFVLDTSGAAAPGEDKRSFFRRQFGRRQDGAPGIANAMMDAINISQDRISRSRLAGDPPDVMIKARLADFGLFDFHRAEELISAGRDAARRAMSDIADHLALAPVGEQRLQTV